MKKLGVPIVMISVLICCFVYIGRNKNLVLEDEIKFEVKNVLEKSKRGSKFHLPKEYPNQVFIEAYENDSLIFNSYLDTLFAPFYSCWEENKDTIRIYGNYGEGNPSSFAIEIIKKKAIVYYSNNSFSFFDKISKTPRGELISARKIECEDSRIVLTNVPPLNKNDTLFGLVELDTGEFFGILSDTENDSIRDKLQITMKCYFSAVECE